jgi:hypothetical protein
MSHACMRPTTVDIDTAGARRYRRKSQQRQLYILVLSTAVFARWFKINAKKILNFDLRFIVNDELMREVSIHHSGRVPRRTAECSLRLGSSRFRNQLCTS